MSEWEQALIERYGSKFVRSGTEPYVYEVLGNYERKLMLRGVSDGTMHAVDRTIESLHPVRPVTKEIEEFVPLSEQPTYSQWAQTRDGVRFEPVKPLGNAYEYGTMKKKTVTTWEPIQ